MLLFTLFCLAIIISSNIDPLAADPEPSRSRYYSWPPAAVIEQANFHPSLNSRTPHRSYFYDTARDLDEDYYNDQSSMTMTKMSRMLELALISLKEEVKDLKDKLATETENNHRLQDRVSQLEKASNNKMKNSQEEDDHYITEYAQLNGALSSALGLGRPWVRTFFSLRKTSPFSALSTPINYEIVDANIGDTVSAAGVFTAPRAGYYFFSFDGVTDGGTYPVNVVLVKNGLVQRTSYGSASNFSRLALQDAWVLSAGDTISIQLAPVPGHDSSTTGRLYEDGSSYYTRFIGYSIVLL